MIVFDLKCAADHRFEAWFRSSTAYGEQQAAGLVECPLCGSTEVSKAPMAPNVAAKGNQKADMVPAPSSDVASVASVASVAAKAGDTKLAEVAAEAQKIIAKLRDHVESTCDYVGDGFAEEARKIHYGEAEERGIYGEASVEDTRELLEEGVDVMPLPGAGRKDA